jgi:hypothetical protein
MAGMQAEGNERQHPHQGPQRDEGPAPHPLPLSRSDAHAGLVSLWDRCHSRAPDKRVLSRGGGQQFPENLTKIAQKTAPRIVRATLLKTTLRKVRCRMAPTLRVLSGFRFQGMTSAWPGSLLPYSWGQLSLCRLLSLLRSPSLPLSHAPTLLQAVSSGEAKKMVRFGAKQRQARPALPPEPPPEPGRASAA